MPEFALSRKVEGVEIVTSGSLVCPSPELCDIQKARRAVETYREYVHRHCEDHFLGDFQGATEEAERNLGLNCFYFDHKYVYGNRTLTPYPFWEIHSFIAEDEWNEDDLEERVPIPQKTFARLPNAADRRPGEARSMKQVELPRQCEKTSIGARAYTVFISKREYFVNGESNYPIMMRSATALNSRDSLLKILRRSTVARTIQRLYGIDLIKCWKCGESTQVPRSAKRCCPTCGEKKKIRIQAISLIDPTRGAGGTGKDSITFRWATKGDAGQADLLPVDDPNYNPFGGGEEGDEEEDAGDGDDAAYSVRAVGLRTEMTGQRPRLYQLDDIQTEDNSDTHEKRLKIIKRFDEAVRQVEFGGRVMVYNTRKYIDDFAGKIGQEPLRGMFHTLHRRVYWATDEPDNPPYVVAGMRYYYPVKGTGRPALDARQVDLYERQMIERTFSAEYLNDPTDEKRATFKRKDFRIVDVNDPVAIKTAFGFNPIEILYGLGRNVSPEEERELALLGLSIQAYNFWDPAGKEEQSKRGDDTFGVGLRVTRYGGVVVTWMAAGQWPSTETWNQVERGNAYNRPRWSDYEMGVDEKNCKPSFQKWLRDRGEALAGITPMIPMHWSHMPKSTKLGRIEKMETWTSNGDFFILSNAAPPDLIEKYISQWVGLGVAAHDDGPDATSRGIKYFMQATYQKPPSEAAPAATHTLAGGVPWSLLKGLGTPSRPKSWGETPS